MAMFDKCKNCKEKCKGEVYRRKSVKHRLQFNKTSTCTCQCNDPEFIERCFACNSDRIVNRRKIKFMYCADCSIFQKHKEIIGE